MRELVVEVPPLPASVHQVFDGAFADSAFELRYHRALKADRALAHLIEIRLHTLIGLSRTEVEVSLWKRADGLPDNRRQRTVSYVRGANEPLAQAIKVPTFEGSLRVKEFQTYDLSKEYAPLSPLGQDGTDSLFT